MMYVLATDLCAHTCWYVQEGVGQMLAVLVYVPLISQGNLVMTT